MSTAIKVENISKAYQIGEFSTGTISKDISRWWALKRGKEDPYQKVGETNDRTTKSTSNVVWSLKDINFDIQQGDTVGIIGKNGAGKSTLLKILSRTTTPTNGSVKIKGRVASLLEVGTGFHGDLTGKENIFLNGAILGMRKHEIKKHFDAIVDFSGVERYIDTPVKRYSSGMYVRLAFAVAAHLESEILIVDEVLAVGDAEFQKKCLGKMGDVSRQDGRTVLFVSHNMSSIEQLCSKGILLKNGSIEFIGSSRDSVKKYFNNENKTKITFVNNENLHLQSKPFLIDAEIDENCLEQDRFFFRCNFKSNNIDLFNPTVGVVISDYLGSPIFGTNSRIHSRDYIPKKCKSGQITLSIEDLSLLPGDYYISIFLGDSIQDFAEYKDALKFEIKNFGLLDSTKIPDSKHIGSLNVKNASWILV